MLGIGTIIGFLIGIPLILVFDYWNRPFVCGKCDRYHSRAKGCPSKQWEDNSLNSITPGLDMFRINRKGGRS